jgi:hypothetical protein
VQRTDTIPATYLPALFAAAFEASARVYEDYSKYDRPIQSFPDPASLLAYVAHSQGAGARHLAFAVHFPDTKGHVRTRKIALKPEKCDGATWRECFEGWGLVHIQLKSLDERLVECRIAVNSEKRARAWASTAAELRDPSLWDWQRVEAHAKRLIRVLRKGASFEVT